MAHSWAPLFRGPGRSRRPLDLAATVGYLVGGGLLVWSAWIHFHLWDDEGYRHIATIGPLFLLQSVAALVIGIGVVAVRRVWAAVVGAGFALGTIAGFLASVSHGLFGFKDSWQAPFAHQAFGIELAAVAVLALAAVLSLAAGSSSAAATSTPAVPAT
jgi:hypothetical protein